MSAFAVAFVATNSFSVTGQILSEPSVDAVQTVRLLKPDDARMLLRHQASEINRRLFLVWGPFEIALTLVLAGSLVFARAPWWMMVLCGLLLIGGLASAFVLAPQILSLGRILDFQPPDPASLERIQFARLHSGYSGLTLGRMGIALVMLVGFLYRRHHSSRLTSSEINGVDDPYDRHIDR